MKQVTLLLSIIVGSMLATFDLQSKPSTNANMVELCEVLKNSDQYDGKEIAFRATHISTFEVSSFVHENCINKENRVWAEFDRQSVTCSTKDEVEKKVEEQVFCCLLADLSSIRQTEMAVTGVFHKPNAQGYGHGSNYRFMVTVKSIKDIGPTRVTKVPGFE